MNDLSPFERHALYLGKLFGNLQSIEIGARLFLDKMNTQRSSPTLILLPQLKKGDLVEVSPLTDGQYLRDVLKEYNEYAPPKQRIEVDRIVHLRNALAHGRVFGYGPMGAARSLRLLKFERKAKNGKVKVSMVEDMTEEWFIQNLKFLESTLERIRIALDWDKAELKTNK